MPVKHITNIKYQGFHPLDKRKTIKKINDFIDRFNKTNEELTQDGMQRWIALCETLSSNISKSSLAPHRDYLTKYQGYGISKASETVTKYSKNREKNFQELVDILINNSKNKLSKINTNLNDNYFFGKNGVKGYIQSEKNKLSDKFDEILFLTFAKMKGFLKLQQHKKIDELNKSCIKWIKIIKDQHYDSKSHSWGKADEQLIIALTKLKKICKNKAGNLSPGEFSILKEAIKTNRNCGNVLTSLSPIKYPPLPKSNINTNRILIAFMGMITDNGTNVGQILLNYVKKR